MEKNVNKNILVNELDINLNKYGPVILDLTEATRILLEYLLKNLKVSYVDLQLAFSKMTDSEVRSVFFKFFEGER
jgi:hypothetical protein